MKAVLLLLLLFTGFGFIPNLRKEFIPPGTVKINDTLYADQAEISNFAWWEYEYSIKIKYGAGSKEHVSVLPDTSVWLKGKHPSTQLARVYYRSPKYKNHPVVGISHKQANAFCVWRTEMVKLSYARVFHKGVQLSYRLPNASEWEMLAYLDCWKIKDSSEALLKKNPDIQPGVNQSPQGIYAFHKNPFGLYNTIGNVAEMITQFGVAKGGSWKHEPEEARPGKQQEYSEPQNWLGFRCVSILHKP